MRPNTPPAGDGPLEIATLAVPGGKGMLGITHCPGRCEAGLGGRELGQDLAAIRAWGATVLVTLIEEHEFALLRVDRLGEMAEAVGLEWHHLPIPDMDVPDWHFGRRWIYSGPRLRRLLRQGGRVVLHCRAGLGRAGTIAAHLLVELGMPAAEAISLVRRARRGAIQTQAQETHVTRVGHIHPETDARMARRLACLLGGALGDGFGYAVEFDRLEAIQRRFGPAGVRMPQFNHGQLVVSDDTQMTLFTLEGLVRGHLQGEAEDDALIRSIRLSYLDWLDTQGGKGESHVAASRLMKHAVMHARQGPGNTCLSALEAGARGTPEAPVNASKGCGGVMRVAPIALLPRVDARRAFTLGVRSAALTHGHPGGHLPAGALAALLRLLLEGRPLGEAAQATRGLLLAWPGHEETLARLDTALEATRHPHLGHLPPALGQGWVGEEALAIGLYAAARSLDFAAVLAIAANHDGDSDSTAAIAGQIFGAQYGLEALPHAWIRRLDVLDALCDVLEWGRPLWAAA